MENIEKELFLQEGCGIMNYGICSLEIIFRRIIKSYPLDLVDESVIANRVLP